MSKIVHFSGDEPFTIRTLLAVVEREGYDLDVPLCVQNANWDGVWLIRGVGLSHPDEVFGQCIEMDRCPPEDWGTHDDFWGTAAPGPEGHAVGADPDADRIISGVYTGVLAALGELDLNTENDDLQQLAEDFADRVWEWFDVKDDDKDEQIAARILKDMS